MALPQPFTGPEHTPFALAGDSTGVVVVHGFPGTPAEMRGLGSAIHDLGHTVVGPLLPGFGPNLPQLDKYSWHDWTGCVAAAVNQLRREHARVLIAGNSMGAALAVLVAAQVQVDGLLLVAPFWRSHLRWLDLVFPLAKPFLARMLPFKKADFSDPEFRRNVHAVMGDIDLDDRAVQEELRRLPLPIHGLAQVRAAGRAAYVAAPRVAAPVWAVIGRRDPVATPALAHKLLARLPALRATVECDAGHDVVQSDWEAASDLHPLLAAFAAGKPTLDHHLEHTAIAPVTAIP
jgi:carboxylesterase